MDANAGMDDCNIDDAMAIDSVGDQKVSHGISNDESYKSLDFLDVVKDDSRYSGMSNIQQIIQQMKECISHNNSNISPEDTAKARQLENIEVTIRRSFLDAISQEKERSSIDSIVVFWKFCLSVCLHILYHMENDNDAYKGLSVHKLPFVLLEDAFDCLSTDQCVDFWQQAIQSNFSQLFSAHIWTPSNGGSNPCWLPFLKMTNKLTKRLDPENRAQVLHTLSMVYPVSEKSANKPWGSSNTDHTTEWDDADDYDEQNALLLSSNTNDATRDYNLYTSFWKLQNDFQNPNSIGVPGFVERCKRATAAFESHKLKIITRNTDDTMTDDDDYRIVEPSSPRYLTSSRLLSLQLCDTDFRLHILTQLLIVVRHLVNQAPILQAQLNDSEQRSIQLIRSIPDIGEAYMDTLDSIFSGSEQSWRNWKRNRCTPDLDKPLSSLHATKKPRRMLGALSSGRIEAKQNGSKNDLVTFSTTMKKKRPASSVHLETFVEALDPDAGIEAEYHPKNNALYCWQALRLLSTDHLQDFTAIQANGDFEGMVRTVYNRNGVVIPGQSPEGSTANDGNVQFKSEKGEHITAANDDNDDNDDDGESIDSANSRTNSQTSVDSGKSGRSNDEQSKSSKNGERDKNDNDNDAENGNITEPADEPMLDNEDQNSLVDDKSIKSDAKVEANNESSNENNNDMIDNEASPSENAPGTKQEMSMDDTDVIASQEDKAVANENGVEDKVLEPGSRELSSRNTNKNVKSESVKDTGSHVDANVTSKTSTSKASSNEQVTKNVRDDNKTANATTTTNSTSSNTNNTTAGNERNYNTTRTTSQEKSTSAARQPPRNNSRGPPMHRRRDDHRPHDADRRDMRRPPTRGEMMNNSGDNRYDSRRGGRDQQQQQQRGRDQNSRRR